MIVVQIIVFTVFTNESAALALATVIARRTVANAQWLIQRDAVQLEFIRNLKRPTASVKAAHNFSDSSLIGLADEVDHADIEEGGVCDFLRLDTKFIGAFGVDLEFTDFVPAKVLKVTGLFCFEFDFRAD